MSLENPSKVGEPICPIHDCYLSQHCSRYGIRYTCSIHGCSVVWWGKKDTMPADYKTRQARIKAHAAIDPIWRNRRMSRYALYRKMKKELGVEHIGLCDTQTCERIIEWTNTL